MRFCFLRIKQLFFPLTPPTQPKKFKIVLEDLEFFVFPNIFFLPLKFFG